jgi:hypothetical protein
MGGVPKGGLGSLEDVFVHAYKNGWGRNAALDQEPAVCKAVLESIPDGEWNTEDTVELGESLEKDGMCKLNELKFQMHTALFRIRLGREIRDDNRIPSKASMLQFCQHPEQESVLKSDDEPWAKGMSIAFLGFQFAFEAFEAANMKVKDNQKIEAAGKRDHEAQTESNHDEEPDDEEAEDKEPEDEEPEEKEKTDQDKEAKQQEQEVVDVNESTKKETDSVMSARNPTKTEKEKTAALQAEYDDEDYDDDNEDNEGEDEGEGVASDKEDDNGDDKDCKPDGGPRKRKKGKQLAPKRSKKSRATNSFQTTSVLKPSATKPRRAKTTGLQNSTERKRVSMAGKDKT